MNTLIDHVLINAGSIETRIALLSDGLLCDLIIERSARLGGRRSVVGAIYLGRVAKVVPGMQAAFIDIGLDRAGFLAVREAQSLLELGQRQEADAPPTPIQQVVHEGQKVVVQAIKDPLGDKGVRLSANLTIPGRYLVHAPRRTGVSLSRRIENQAERERLLAMMAPFVAAEAGTGGFIVRTVAEGASEQDLAADAEGLRARWNAIAAGGAGKTPPLRLTDDPGPVERMLRDYAGGAVRRIDIDDAAAYAEARTYCARFAPSLSSRLHHHRGSVTLFDEFNVEDQIEAALQSSVPLPSGGSVTIESTEALTAIDVNSGRLTDGTSLEDTSLRTNQEAAHEIARQLRLRAMGGIVVIDFIHMEKPKNVAKVMTALESAFVGDPAPVRIIGMSELGLVQLTRKRTGESLAQSISTACSSCAGSGRRPDLATVAAAIERMAVREISNNPSGRLEVHAAAGVAEWFADPENAGLEALQARLGVTIDIVPEAGWSREQFHVSTGAG